MAWVSSLKRSHAFILILLCITNSPFFYLNPKDIHMYTYIDTRYNLATLHYICRQQLMVERMDLICWELGLKKVKYNDFIHI